MKDLHKEVRKAIEKSVDVLLASPGLDGIRASKLKAPTIHNIVTNIHEHYGGPVTRREVIDTIFEELELAYKSDSQFFGFSIDELEKFIIEERTYVIGYLGG